jgi:hypothetical protein
MPDAVRLRDRATILARQVYGAEAADRQVSGRRGEGVGGKESRMTVRMFREA